MLRLLRLTLIQLLAGRSNTMKVTMNIIAVGYLALALISVPSAILLIWMSHKKITKSRAQVDKATRSVRVKMARALIMEHSNPRWREEQLRMLNKIE